MYREVHFDGKVGDQEARFTVDLAVESMTTNTISAPLFMGEVAVIAPEIPEGLRIVNTAHQYRLVATQPGTYRFQLELVAKITKAEPWNQISFTAPDCTALNRSAAARRSGFPYGKECIFRPTAPSAFTRRT